MEKRISKELLIEACIVKHQNVIDDMRTRVADLLGDAGLGNEEMIETGIQVMNAQKAVEIQELNTQINFARSELAILQSIVPNHRDTPGLGAVVVTNRKKFFVSVSIEEFVVGGEVYFGLSTRSPLYKKMEGKKQGESFDYNGTRYDILDLY